MRKISTLFLILISSLLTVVSCENEPLDGVFYSTGDGSDPSVPDPDSQTCENAFEVLQNTAISFGSANESSYSAACVSYKAALEASIENCGDDSGELQALITSLGDCTEVSPCLQVEVNSAAALYSFNNSTLENEEEFCMAYEVALQNQINLCGDSNGALAQIINNLNCRGECGVAQDTTTTAYSLFENVDPLDEDLYVEACTAYSLALQAEIAVCGDPDGSLLLIVQELGTCAPPEIDGPIQFYVDGNLQNYNTASVTINGSTLIVNATDIDTGDVVTFNLVLQQTGDNIVQDLSIEIDGVNYLPVITGDSPFINTITTNDGSTIQGTFGGTLESEDGTVIIATAGIIDITY